MKRYTTGLSMVAVLLVAALAHGQRSGAAAAEIRQLHILAMENYDLADYASARDQLLSAVAKAREGNIEKELLNARTHLMLGAIYVLGAGDQAKAMEHFKIALTIAPAIQPEPPFDTEAVKAAMARADAELNPVITCETLRGIDHQQVAQVDEGQPVKVVFRAGPELRKGTAHLSYRTEEARDFVDVDMSAQGDCEYVGEIPADAVSGTTLHYFVSMKKDDGRYIAMRGNQKSPYPINVIDVAEPLPDPTKETRDEVPDELNLGKPKPRGAGCAGCGVAGQGGPGGLALLVLVCAACLGRRRRT